ncbi:hypothetical protein J6590_007372 [Homalodisca vitripennis]|nr:hypothetical protein J6590_007372 [Homalodisca vitripennis]
MARQEAYKLHLILKDFSCPSGAIGYSESMSGSTRKNFGTNLSHVPHPTLWCGVPWISQQLARAREKAGKDRPRLVEVRLDLHKPYGAGDLAAVLI